MDRIEAGAAAVGEAMPALRLESALARSLGGAARGYVQPAERLNAVAWASLYLEDSIWFGLEDRKTQS